MKPHLLRTHPTMFLGLCGMVGAGKTTMTKALARHFHLKTAFEGVATTDNPWLAKFYGEPDGRRRYALPLQLYFLEDRADGLRRIRREGGDWIADQVIYADAEIFARGHYEAGLMTAEEWAVYERRYQEILASTTILPPDLLIYLYAPLETILERIQQRGREAEKDTDVGYWRELYGRYQRWVRTFRHCPVLELDVREYDLHNDPQAIHDIARRIRAALARETGERVQQHPSSTMRRRLPAALGRQTR